jgi:YbbR domain-containing protein
VDFLRRHVLNHFGLKLLSLAIAVMLWMAIVREPVAEVAITVPIEFHNGPDDLEINSEVIPQVQVRVRGANSLLRDLGTDDVHAIIDLNFASSGEHTYDLNPKAISVPRDIHVVQVIPSQFRLSLDRRATKMVEVRPRVIGATAPGFRMEDVKVEPSSISIVGPEKRVQAIDSVITDPVDASGVMGSASFSTHVFVSDPLVRLANPGPVRVTVLTDTKHDTASIIKR